MEQRVYHGAIQPEGVAQALLDEWDRDTTIAQAFGAEDYVVVQIGQREAGWLSDEPRQALTVTIEPIARSRRRCRAASGSRSIDMPAAPAQQLARRSGSRRSRAPNAAWQIPRARSAARRAAHSLRRSLPVPTAGIPIRLAQTFVIAAASICIRRHDRCGARRGVPR
jgi:hypothetical protein